MILSAAGLTYLQGAREGVVAREMLWVEATDNGSPAPLGLWSGDDHQTITVDGEARAYFGRQGLLSCDTLVDSEGTDVRTLLITLSGTSQEAQELIKGRVIRRARAQVHIALLDPVSHLITSVELAFEGFVNRAPQFDAALGGTSHAEIELASVAREMTRPNPLLNSHEAQSQRLGDAFMQYVSVDVTTPWVRK